MPSMFVVRLLPFIQSLSERKWSDEDIVEDINYLKEELSTRLEGLTTFDEYVSELESGHLVWSPAHESDDFWRLNSSRIANTDDGKLIKRLVEILKSSKDPVVLSVAQNDVAKFVKHGGERAKNMIGDLGGKRRVMELMADENPDVRYYALMAVQSLMSMH